jgi:hypothetical protein
MNDEARQVTTSRQKLSDVHSLNPHANEKPLAQILLRVGERTLRPVLRSAELPPIAPMWARLFEALCHRPKFWAMGKFERNLGAKSPFFVPK